MLEESTGVVVAEGGLISPLASDGGAHRPRFFDAGHGVRENRPPGAGCAPPELAAHAARGLAPPWDPVVAAAVLAHIPMLLEIWFGKASKQEAHVHAFTIGRSRSWRRDGHAG